MTIAQVVVASYLPNCLKAIQDQELDEIQDFLIIILKFGKRAMSEFVGNPDANSE